MNNADPLFEEFSRQVAAGANVFGGLVLAGGATWAPVRAADFDTAAWGPWEVWEHCQIGPVNDGAAMGPVATGAWVAWDSVSGQVMGHPPGPTARVKAEMMAVIQNQGRPTRVVPLQGDPVASALDYAEVDARVRDEMDRMRQAGEGP